MTERDDFLARIRADQDDDALRAVFADFLLEHGDPRGELIQIQLAKHRGEATPKMLRRERELVTKNKIAFVDGIDQTPHVTRRELLRFERGFLVACAVAARGFAAVPEHPAWSTVRELVFMGPTDLRSAEPLVRWLGAATHAHTVHNLHLEPLVGFARDGSPKLTTMSVSGRNVAAVPHDLLVAPGGALSAPVPFDGPGLGELRRFGIKSIFYTDTSGAVRMVGHWTDWLHTMPFVRRLEELDVHPGASFSHVHTWMVAHPSLLPRITQHPSHADWFGSSMGWTITLARDESGSPCRLDARWTGASHTVAYELIDAIASLPADALVTVRIVRTKPSRGAVEVRHLDLREAPPPDERDRDRESRTRLAEVLGAQTRLREIVYAGRPITLPELAA